MFLPDVATPWQVTDAWGRWMERGIDKRCCKWYSTKNMVALGSGAFGVDTSRTDGDEIEFLWTSGSWDGKISFTITDPGGGTVYNGRARVPDLLLLMYLMIKLWSSRLVHPYPNRVLRHWFITCKLVDKVKPQEMVGVLPVILDTTHFNNGRPNTCGLIFQVPMQE